MARHFWRNSKQEMLHCAENDGGNGWSSVGLNADGERNPANQTHWYYQKNCFVENTDEGTQFDRLKETGKTAIYKDIKIASVGILNMVIEIHVLHISFNKEASHLDPYSAAAFQGFNASVGSGNTTHENNATPYSAQLPNAKSAVHDGRLNHSAQNSEMVDGVDETSFLSVGMHLPILKPQQLEQLHSVDTKLNSVVKERREKTPGVVNHSAHLQIRNNALNEEVRVNEKPVEQSDVHFGLEMDQPAVAVAQVTPMVTKSQGLQNMVATDVVASSEAPAALVFGTNVARVGPISSHQSDSGSFVNRVAPTMLQAAVVQQKDVPLAPQNATDTSVEDSGCRSNWSLPKENENTTAIRNDTPESNLIVNSAAVVPKKELKEMSERSNAQTEMLQNLSTVGPKVTIDSFAAGSAASPGIASGIADRDFKGVINNEVGLSSAEQSTDSANIDEFFDENFVSKRVSKNIRERYKHIRQQYPEVVKRLDRIKAETKVVDRNTTPKPNVAIKTETQRAEEGDAKMSRNIMEERAHTPVVVKREDVELNSWAAPMMKHSFTFPERGSSDDSSVRAETAYGEELITSMRRRRRAREREHDSVAMRGTRSEIGEMRPYKGPAAEMQRRMMMQQTYGYSQHTIYPLYNYHSTGRQSTGPFSSRHGIYGTLPRRPQSSFDAASFARYQQEKRINCDRFMDKNGEADDNEGSLLNGDGSSESDNELAEINHVQEMAKLANLQYNSMTTSGLNEYYYFGVIQLSQDRVRDVLYKLPPPPEYFRLPPIEKAAYLFYCMIYQCHYRSVDQFHKIFNREFYNYLCKGDSPEMALLKICEHTREEFLARRTVSQLRAYEMSQKQLFSDDRETLDSRQSERGSRCDVEEESDRLSVESAVREPMKFRSSHSFLRFGASGKVIMLRASVADAVVELCDMKELLTDPKEQHLADAIESFKGPLIAGVTPTHSVRLFIQRRIEAIMKSDAYRADPINGAASDCLLVWQLLEMLVQQQGRVTGPDLSRLLVMEHETSHCDDIPLKNAVSVHKIDEGHVSDPESYERFTQLLLGGHLKEAVNSAVKDGLYSDALILARRIYNDPQEVEKVEAAFLARRSEHNPVMTLLSVANGQPAPFLTSPSLRAASSWRSHAAIVLANLNSPAALGTIYQLGLVLARREQNAAADFCFLAVSLLGVGYDPFEPVAKSEEDVSSGARQHITLIHASLDEDDIISREQRFNVADLHATEIFEYATRLACDAMPVPLTRAIAYQLCRLDYAHAISELGCYVYEAFRYCVEVARSLWERCSEVDIEQLKSLYELGDRLHLVASADAGDIAWLPMLRTMIDDKRKIPSSSKAENAVRKERSRIESHENGGLVLTVNTTQHEEKRVEETHQKMRTTSLEAEAIDWHAEHQEPIQMTSVNHEKNESVGSDHQQRQRLDEGVDRKPNTSSSGTAEYLSLPPSPPNYEPRGAVQATSSTSGTSVTTTNTPSAVGDNKVTEITYRTEETADITTTESSSLESTPQKSILNETIKGNERIATLRQVDHHYNEYGVKAHMSAKNDSKKNEPHIEKSASAQQLSENTQQAKHISGVKTGAKTNGKMSERQNSGLFSKLKATLAKAIPSTNEMILPDDKNPTIVWDPKLNRYVGAGVEEEVVPEPPPSVASSEMLHGSSQLSSSGLTAARISGGSRYFNPLIETAPSKPVASSPVPVVPSVPVPASFGFIPAMPDNDEETGTSPFSVSTTADVKTAEESEKTREQ